MQNKFTEEDHKLYVESLNWIAKNAKFGDGPVDVAFGITLRNHFAYLQSIASKISDNILEVKALHTPEEKNKKAGK